MRTFARRSSMFALAGVLALGAVACGDDDEGTDIDVTEEETDPVVTDEDTVTEEETETETETETELLTETETEMTTPSETATE